MTQPASPDRPTAADERRLKTAMERAFALCEAGDSPTRAVAKAAAESGLDAEGVRLVGRGFNTGRQLQHWEAAADATEKLAGHPIVDVEAAVRLSLTPAPAPEKAAYAYSRPPQPTQPVSTYATVKTAAAARAKPAPETRPETENDRWLRRKAARDASAECGRLERELLVKASALREYLSAPAIGHGSAGDLLEACQAYGPAPDSAVLKFACAGLPAAYLRPQGGDWRTPLALLRACHALGGQLAEARVKEAALRPAKPVLEPLPPRHGPSILPDPLTLAKEAGGLLGLPGAETALGMTAANAIRPLAGPDPDTNRLVQKLNDPDQDAELRRIQTQATLTSMMNDPDDPVSGYDPAQVVDAFNQISSLAPRSATQPAAIGPAMRRQLAGRFEPHETEQILKIDQALGRQQPQPQRPGALDGGLVL